MSGRAQSLGTGMTSQRTRERLIQRLAQDIKNEVDRISSFPVDAEEPKVVIAQRKRYVISLALYGDQSQWVLRDMAERTGVSDVQSFVTVLIQSASFGTSIAEALRVFSDEMRDKRVMRAEEKANTLPTKMTLATMMLTVPPLLIILIGPSVYEIAVTLGGSDF